MHVAYARSTLPRSIFLAGPTPRSPKVESWRPLALERLRYFGFDGTVFVPEDGDGSCKFSYDDQIEWELQALHSATVVAFWVPRELLSTWEPKELTMPALTTNVEFGLFAHRRNVVLGCPPEAEKVKYLQGIAKMYGISVFETLDSTLIGAIDMAERPFRTS